jgi:hypothetical protein
MATEYMVASDVIVEIAQDLISKYHPTLLRARIGLVMREPAAKSGGKVVYGQARKVSEQDKLFIPYDFIIVLAADEWRALTPIQRRALIDHELCHCKVEYDQDGDLTYKIVRHDIEEFNCILERYGWWWPSAGASRRAVEQMHLPLDDGEGPPTGTVEAIDPAVLLREAGREFVRQFPDSEIRVNGESIEPAGEPA